MSRNGGDNVNVNVNVRETFRCLKEKAERKYARVREVPAYGVGVGHRGRGRELVRKVFKAYTEVWRYQQRHRTELGLERWEIGEIASRIGQLYYSHYLRTSESRFLIESYVFYHAVIQRSYYLDTTTNNTTTTSSSLALKELRFLARFLLVSLILSRPNTVNLILDRFRSLLNHTSSSLPEANLKEWKLVLHEFVRFINADKPFPNARPLRYSPLFDTHPDSLPYVARFHAKNILNLHHAVLTSYHTRNEIKFAELTLDTFRMLQCLEWEPSGSFYHNPENEPPTNGAFKEYSATSGLIDINLAADFTDPTLTPNPKKALLYRPNSTHLLAVIATVCEELPPESVMLLYISSISGTASTSRAESSSSSRRFSKSKFLVSTSSDPKASPVQCDDKKGYLSGFYDNSLCLSPRGIRGSNHLYPGDLLPFTRRPIFLIIDSDNSHAFKVIHGSERGEPSALLLSPLRPSFKSPRNLDETINGSQFTLFLTAPLQAFCQVVGLSVSDRDTEIYDEAEYIIANAFAKWEVMLCSSTKVDLVWAQVLPDPFLRRIILRFIFCRAVLSLFHTAEAKESYAPDCLPHLPGFVSPDAEAVESYISRLADHLSVSDCFDNT